MSESIFLGALESKINENEEIEYDCKLGGSPKWLVAPPNKSDLLCSECGSNLTLLIELYAPLTFEKKSYDRILYVFCCLSSSCKNQKNSWKVFRSQKESELQLSNENNEQSENKKKQKEKEKEEEKEEEEKNELDFGFDDDWGSDSGSGSGSEFNVEKNSKEKDEDLKIEKLLQQTEKQLLSKNNNQNRNKKNQEKPKKHKNTQKQENNKKPRQDILVLPSYSIELYEEPELQSQKQFQYENKLLQKYLENNEIEVEEIQKNKKSKQKNTNKKKKVNKNLGKEKEKEKEIFEDEDEEEEEDDEEDFGDFSENKQDLFDNFIERIQLSPEQLLRYQFDGKPILASPFPIQKVPKCSCGAKRIFEMQIVSSMRSQIGKYLSPKQLEKLEFVNVMVFSCSNSCSKKLKNGICKEYIHVQTEEPFEKKF
ncbi:programmed cell death protein 2-like [Anaeramoeba flamelloides]|uniref:Programmed cell death protein 2-like n=1 Tax=Anaeramoeba flamelloides TaxID=1746091 RepID=A0ABQ8XBL6_9EUKA|nr:programmed cell death protein 2-like [Anaeramoeba flamelloides]